MDTSIFRKFSYGLYVIGSTTGERLNGQIANTVFQISSEPPTVAISINKNNLTNEFIKKSKAFSICILPQSTPLSFIGHFGFKSGRDIDKFQAIPFKLGATGVPILLENSLGYLEAEVINSVEVETHTVFIGKIINVELINDEEPLTYAHYQQLKRGSTPTARPNTDVLQPIENSTDANKNNQMQKYECTVCGYIYDPAVGDPDSGIAPGTLFEDIPEDWVCPVCGVPKSEFRAIG